MKTVVIGEGADVTMKKIMEVYPRHKIVAEKYINRGDVIGKGSSVTNCSAAEWDDNLIS